MMFIGVCSMYVNMFTQGDMNVNRHHYLSGNRCKPYWLCRLHFPVTACLRQTVVTFTFIPLILFELNYGLKLPWTWFTSKSRLSCFKLAWVLFVCLFVCVCVRERERERVRERERERQKCWLLSMTVALFLHHLWCSSFSHFLSVLTFQWLPLKLEKKPDSFS